MIFASWNLCRFSETRVWVYKMIMCKAHIFLYLVVKKGLSSSALDGMKSFSNDRYQCSQNVLLLDDAVLLLLTGHLALSSGGAGTTGQPG